MNERDEQVAIMKDFYDFAKLKLKETDHFVYSLPNSQHKIEFAMVDTPEKGRLYRIKPIRQMPDRGTNSLGCFWVPTNDAEKLRNAIGESIHQLLFVERADKDMSQQRPSLASLIDNASSRVATQKADRPAPTKEFAR